MPVRARTMSTSPRDSEACVCTSMPPSAESAATASSNSRVHDTAKRGANAVRTRPFAAPSQRAFSPSASSMALVVSSRSRAGTSSSASIRHLPIVARRPLDAISSQTTSVSCTVSIVRTVVVPPRSSSHAARRADARKDGSV